MTVMVLPWIRFGFVDGRTDERREKGELERLRLIARLSPVGRLTYALREERDAGEGHEYLHSAHNDEGQVEPSGAVHGPADERAEQLGHVHRRAGQRLQGSGEETYKTL